jgi:hypothetical protein
VAGSFEQHEEILEVQKMLGDTSVAERLLDSHEGLSLMELFKELHMYKVLIHKILIVYMNKHIATHPFI